MTIEIEQKVWGVTSCELATDHYSRHVLALEPLSYCSVHHHRHRANLFRVIRGEVAIVQWWAWNFERTILTRDMTLVVPSLVVHQFQVLQHSEMVEEYWPDRGGVVRCDDIVRFRPGGKVESVEQFLSLPFDLMEQIDHA